MSGSPIKLLPTTGRKPLLVGGRCWCCPARSLVGKIPRFEASFFLCSRSTQKNSVSYVDFSVPPALRYALATIPSIDIALI